MTAGILPGIASDSRSARCAGAVVIVFGLCVWVDEHDMGMANDVELLVGSAGPVRVLLEGYKPETDISSGTIFTGTIKSQNDVQSFLYCFLMRSISAVGPDSSRSA